jgi:hypothetical protein
MGASDDLISLWILMSLFVAFENPYGDSEVFVIKANHETNVCVVIQLGLRLSFPELKF